jgi:hypothetical protein
MKRVLAAALAVATVVVVVLSACTAVPEGPDRAAINLGGDVPDKPVSGGGVYLVPLHRDYDSLNVGIGAAHFGTGFFG